MAADFVSKVEPVNFAVDGLSIRRARESDSDFVFAVKEAAFREYVNQVLGLGSYPPAENARCAVCLTGCPNHPVSSK